MRARVARSGCRRRSRGSTCAGAVGHDALDARLEVAARARAWRPAGGRSANSSVSRTSTIATPSSISSCTSAGSTSSIWLLTWRRSSAPDGLIAKLLNHGRDSVTSQSIAPARPARCGPLAYPRRSRTPAHGPVTRLRLATAARRRRGDWRWRAAAAARRGLGPRPRATTPATRARRLRRRGAARGVAAPPFTLTDQDRPPGLARRADAARSSCSPSCTRTCGDACALIAQQMRGALDELRRGAVPALLGQRRPARRHARATSSASWSSSLARRPRALPDAAAARAARRSGGRPASCPAAGRAAFERTRVGAARSTVRRERAPAARTARRRARRRSHAERARAARRCRRSTRARPAERAG